MAVVFLLGPSVWEVSKKAFPGFSPMRVRREIAVALRGDGHIVILMEDDPERPEEDLISKFDRLLRQGVTDVVVYWPPAAKMQTTYDELILLCDRHEFLKTEAIPVWVMHHVSVASIQKDQFIIKESGNRSRYLTAVVRLGVHPLEWADEKDLAERVHLLSAELRR
jgi:hypothetical protein